MTLLAALAVSIVFVRSVLARGEHHEQQPTQALHDPMPTGTEPATVSQAAASDKRANPDEYESHKEHTRKPRELTEWEHMDVDRYDGGATLRTVKSIAPKGLCSNEEVIQGEAEEKRREERRMLREQLGIDKKREGEFVIL
ncbi:hypothetical protein LTR36_006340 [Oleoguttula mirabilis]|uniref:Uncharacterized protein n=1 Tax=Oleoguttula mirabilis TaxID=1507867 RepID=A0AAV9JXH3_9PEZI|nr:hypothetical protein LTR36_006340 [Oleoguttula mirabilis]